MKIHNHGLGLHVAEDGNPDGPTLAEHSRRSTYVSAPVPVT